MSKSASPEFTHDVQKTLTRLLPRIQPLAKSDTEWQAFEANLLVHFPRLFELLRELYGAEYDFFFHLEQILGTAFRSWQARPATLKKQDKQRVAQPDWFRDEQMLGAACYVDLFAGDLNALQSKIPYFKELGLTYLHLMPLFKAPQEDSDGGYAVSDYRQVDPALGTMADLKKLATALRKEGISLVLDFVFNHTSDEHAWAEQAKQGNPEYMDYYFCFEDRTEVDEYERTLREIFPEIRKGCFTWREDMQRWVWTTFNSFQWDLNYRNPAVFNAMAGELLYLANAGADVLRFDALAFVWKEKGTSCENLPKAHTVIQAFNAMAAIAAPGLLFKSEAIVHPDEVVKYIGRDECQLSYNPLLMAMLWNSLATRKTRLMTRSLQARFPIDGDCAWVNYIRCHDDIGWTFDDNIAWQLGINPDHHRQFLNRYYTGQFEGSFARGVPFQENPLNGDCRVAGMLGSLVGLEKGLEEDNPAVVDMAIRRILLLHAIMFSIGGVPLLYLGDELGLLNDYSYEQHPTKHNDSRWVNRVAVNDDILAQRTVPGTVAHKVFYGLQRLTQVRRSLPILGRANTEILDSGNVHVFGFARVQGDQRLLVLANFAETPQAVSQEFVQGVMPSKGLHDVLTSTAVEFSEQAITLQPYEVRWLQS